MDCHGNCARVVAAAQLDAGNTAGVKVAEYVGSIYWFSPRKGVICNAPGKTRKEDLNMWGVTFSAAQKYDATVSRHSGMMTFIFFFFSGSMAGYKTKVKCARCHVITFHVQTSVWCMDCVHTFLNATPIPSECLPLNCQIQSHSDLKKLAMCWHFALTCVFPCLDNLSLLQVTSEYQV